MTQNIVLFLEYVSALAALRLNLKNKGSTRTISKLFPAIKKEFPGKSDQEIKKLALGRVEDFLLKEK